MAPVATLAVRVTAQLAEFRKEFATANKTLSTFASEFEGIATRASAVGSFFGNIASQIATSLARGLGSAIRDAVKFSAEFQNAFIGLSSVARAFGTDSDAAADAARRLSADGLLPLKDSATGLKKLLATGFSLPESTRLMEAFKDSAAFGRQGALSFGDAIRSATDGVKNGNSILVDNAGITKNLSQILKEAGFSAQDLSRASSDAGVRMALFNGILKESAAFAGDAQRATQTYTGQIARLETQYNTFLATVGDAIVKNRAVAETIGAVSDVLGDLSSAFRSNGAAANFVSDVLITFVGVLSSVVKGINAILFAVNAMDTGFAELTRNIATDVKKLADLFLEVAILGSKLPGGSAALASIKNEITTLAALSVTAGSTIKDMSARIEDNKQRVTTWGGALTGFANKLDALQLRLIATRGETVKLGDGTKAPIKGFTDLGNAAGKTSKELDRAAKEAEELYRRSHKAAEGLEEMYREMLRVGAAGEFSRGKAGLIELTQSIEDAVDRIKLMRGLIELPIRGGIEDFWDSIHEMGNDTSEPVRTLRTAFTDLGRDLPQLIFGALQSGNSIVGTVAHAAAGQFMAVFNDAIERISKQGGTLKTTEKLAGIIGAGLSSLVNGIALGGQTTSLLKGGLAGAASGALAGANPLLSGPTLGASIAIGAGVGLIGGLLGASGAKKEEKEALRQAKEAFKVQFGGLEKLQQLADKAGISLDRALNAPSAGRFNRAIEDINKQLAVYNKHLEGLSTAVDGVNSRATVFANNFSALITKRDELLDGGSTGELDAVNAKIAETAQRVQPEFERLGLMVRDTFAGLVRESGNAFTAIQALAPAFTTLQAGVEDFGLTSTGAIDELLASFRLVNDETLGPFLQNIQASGQVLKGLFDAKALSPEGFQAIAADIGQSLQEIANRGGDITRAMALNQPILQTLFEAQERFGAITDDTTLSILRQAEAQGLVGNQMKDVNERILDVLIAIADVFGAVIPDALRDTATAAQDAASDIEDALAGINVPEITIPVSFDRIGEDIVEIPALAHGGVVRRPTLALVGEAGPEAVVPLSQASRFAEMNAETVGGQTFHVTINGDVDTDARAERVVQDFARVVRRGGRLRTVALQSLGVE